MMQTSETDKPDKPLDRIAQKFRFLLRWCADFAIEYGLPVAAFAGGLAFFSLVWAQNNLKYNLISGLALVTLGLIAQTVVSLKDQRRKEPTPIESALSEHLKELTHIIIHLHDNQRREPPPIDPALSQHLKELTQTISHLHDQSRKERPQIDPALGRHLKELTALLDKVTERAAGQRDEQAAGEHRGQ